MTQRASTVLADALNLPENERALIAEKLLATLSPEVEDQLDDELAEELNRRLEEYKRDPSSAVRWEDLKNEA